MVVFSESFSAKTLTVHLLPCLSAARKKPLVVKPIFISVDPSRDTVGQIRHYAKDFHKSFVFLTGTKDMVAAATKVYRVYFSKVKHAVK